MHRVVPLQVGPIAVVARIVALLVGIERVERLGIVPVVLQPADESTGLVRCR